MCLINKKRYKNNETIEDWRKFDFSKIEKLNGKIVSNKIIKIPFKIKSIETHCFVDFYNLEELSNSKNLQVP